VPQAAVLIANPVEIEGICSDNNASKAGYAIRLKLFGENGLRFKCDFDRSAPTAG
jgi:hypothetical protein